MSSKGFRPPTSFQSHIKCSESGYPCLSILSGKPSGTSYVLFCHLPEPPLLLPTTNLWLQRAATSLSLTGIWATATAPHRKQVLLALHTLLPRDGCGIPTSHMWPQFLNSHHARVGMKTSQKHVFLCRSPVPRKQQRALGLGSELHFLHCTHSSWVWGPHTPTG